MSRLTILGLLILLALGVFVLARPGNEVTAPRPGEKLLPQTKDAVVHEEAAVPRPKAPFSIVEFNIGSGDELDDPDLEFLKRMGVATDARSLIRFLEDRSPTDVDPENLEPWIRQLSDRNFEKRREASKKLADVELAALSALQKAAKDKDIEIAKRASELVERLENDPYWGLPLAAVRKLIKQRVPNKIETLLRFLPFATWDELNEEIWYGVDANRFKNGQIHPALIAALQDRSQAKRALAGCILGKDGTPQQKEMASQLLKDKDANVRLRTSQGLMAGNDISGIPVLIELLKNSEIAISWQAEELLQWLAGHEGPQVVIGAARESDREMCHKAWKDWWNTKKERFSVEAKHHSPNPRLLLITDSSGGLRPHRVWLCGSDGKVRWKLENVFDPIEAQITLGNKVLVASLGKPSFESLERVNSGIIEYDLDGKIFSKAPLWARQTFRKFPNGSIANYSPRGFLLSTIAGREIFRAEPDHSFSTAQFLQQSAYLEIDFPEVDGQVLRIQEKDVRTGKVFAVSDFRLNSNGAHFFHAATQGDGTLLIWMRNPDKLFEFSCSGKRLLRTLQIPGIWAACRQRSGSLIIAQSERSESRILEINETGTLIWEAFSDRREVERIDSCFRLICFGFTKRSFSK